MRDSALQLESRFSLSPNSLGYCGKKSATAKFKSCIINGKCDGVREELKNFIVLYPYLKTLGKIFNKSFSAYPVIESYWLGNDELKKAKKTDYQILLENFKKQGVPDFFIEGLKLKRPKKFIPNHLFHVLFVGAGRMSGAVPFNLLTVNNCMIRWSTVQKLSKKEAVILLNSLKFKKPSAYSLIQIKTSIPFNPKFTPDLKVGDTVAVHWGLIIKALKKQEGKNLTFWTKKVLQLFS